MNKLLVRVLVLAVWLLGAPAWALAADFTVSSSGQGAYLIKVEPSGTPTANPTLTLTRGRTYTFDVTVGGHPFWIKTIPETGTSDTYDTGVTNNGASPGVVTFTVPASAPTPLYYQCQYHDPMNGMLNLVSAAPPAPSVPATTDASGVLLSVALAVLGGGMLSGAGIALGRRKRAG